MKIHNVQFGLIPLVFGSVMFSCSGGLLEDMSRVLHDPVIEAPAAVSFENEDSIELAWEKDEGADEYLLYRAPDTAVPVYESIYRGKECTYKDTDVTAGNRYLYTLTKVRGTKLFGPSDAVLGADSGVVLDSLENNNTKEKASLLEWDLQANLYYYQSYGDEKLVDYDWYRVTVPPRRKALVVITQGNLAAGASSWITYALESMPPFTVINGAGIEISNTTYKEKTFFFRLSPKQADFVNDLTKGGGSFVSYSLSLSQITGL